MKLASVISNGAVLQRQMPIRVWGETLPNVLVQAELAGKAAYAKSSRTGEFLLHLPPMEAGGPFELTVSVPDIADETLTLHDILIGEVWLCSGQSNMSYRLNSGCVPQTPEEAEPLCRRQEREFLDTVCPNGRIRFITIPMEVTGCREKYFDSPWRPMTRENAPEAFAVPAWFGAKLNEELNVPIGLLCCAWGGSVIETWTSSAALRSNPDTRPLLEAWEECRQGKDAWLGEPRSEGELLSEIAVPDRGNSGFAQGWAAPECDDSDWMDMEIPGSWLEQGLGGNGAIWCRLRVNVPAEFAGKELFLKTGGIDKHDTAYFNGVEIGHTGKELETQFWAQPRCYRIPAELVRAGENTIAIRAFSFAQDGAFGEPGKCYALCGDGLEIPLAGTWKAKMEYDLGHITLPPRFSVKLHNTPAMQFDSMLRPLLPFAFQGAIWYQGEGNGNSMKGSLTYQRKMETMIRDWRFHFELPDMPFIQVQLADFRTPKPYDVFSDWAVLREAQRKACQTLPRVYMVTALGTGEEDDIHPQDKKEVGHRLAASALHHVYGKAVLPSGPEFRKAVPEDGALRVFFDDAGGMELRDQPGKSLYIAGADGKFHPVDSAVIDGDSILLKSTKVKKPLFVRYAWSDNPNNILYNRLYPAASFSSEDYRAFRTLDNICLESDM